MGRDSLRSVALRLKIRGRSFAAVARRAQEWFDDIPTATAIRPTTAALDLRAAIVLGIGLLWAAVHASRQSPLQLGALVVAGAVVYYFTCRSPRHWHAASMLALAWSRLISWPCHFLGRATLFVGLDRRILATRSRASAHRSSGAVLMIGPLWLLAHLYGVQEFRSSLAT
jgi:hypothetical protein